MNDLGPKGGGCWKLRVELAGYEARNPRYVQPGFLDMDIETRSREKPLSKCLNGLPEHMSNWRWETIKGVGSELGTGSSLEESGFRIAVLFLRSMGDGDKQGNRELKSISKSKRPLRTKRI